MLTIFCNEGSLVLGLAAWALAILALSGREPAAVHRRSAGSFGLCAGALLLQLVEVWNRVVRLGDCSAVEDTIGAVVVAAIILVAVTVLLNALAWRKAR